MTKLLQNRISESKLTLPVTVLCVTGVWLLAGLTQGDWWASFACFVVSTYLMIELNNSNALIRIYSRMVSCVFLVLSAVACPLFASTEGAWVQVCVVGALLMIFRTYQDGTSVGSSYYAYLCIGLASLSFVQIVCLIPLLFLMHGVVLHSLSWRTFFAGFFGLLTPYWFWTCWSVYQQSIDQITDHFMALTEWSQPFDFSAWDGSQVAVLLLLALISVIGIVHYIRTSYLDRIRVRQLYHVFSWSVLLMFACLLLQPTLYNILTRMLIVFVSPLLAHYLALTHTRITNITFQVLLFMAVLLTIYNLWTSSLHF